MHPFLERLRRQTGIPSDWAATSNASWVFPWRSDYKWLTHTVALKVRAYLVEFIIVYQIRSMTVD
jgi:hypothetical protein